MPKGIGYGRDAKRGRKRDDMKQRKQAPKRKDNAGRRARGQGR